MPFGTIACPACGRPLWFLTVGESLAFFRHADAPFVHKLFAAVPHHQRVPAALGLDSIDVLEMVAAFEAALDEAG